MTIKSLPKLPSLPKSRVQVACDCGCGGQTGSRFVPGHDSKLKGMRIRVERGLWTATPEGKPIDAVAQLDALAEAMSPAMAAATAKEMRIDWKPKSERKTA
jgi:hypothetical protein